MAVSWLNVTWDSSKPGCQLLSDGGPAVPEVSDVSGEGQKCSNSLLQLLSSPATWAIIVVNCVNHWGCV